MPFFEDSYATHYVGFDMKIEGYGINDERLLYMRVKLSDRTRGSTYCGSPITQLSIGRSMKTRPTAMFTEAALLRLQTQKNRSDYNPDLVEGGLVYLQGVRARLPGSRPAAVGG